MKKRALIVALLTLFLWPSFGLAQCPEGLEQVLLEEMGSFSPGMIWTWDESFLGHISGPPPGPMEVPTRMIQPVHNRMDIKRYVDASFNETRFAVRISKVFSYPIYCRDANMAPPNITPVIEFIPPLGCADPANCPPNNLFGICNPTPDYVFQEGEISCTDPVAYPGFVCPDPLHPNPCCRWWVDGQVQRHQYIEALTAEQIASVEWHGHETENPAIHDVNDESLFMWYNQGAGGNPINWWEGQSDFNAGHEIWIIYDGIPELQLSETIMITFKADEGLPPEMISYDVTGTDPMPTIPAMVTNTQTVYNKRGRVIKGLSGLEIEADNIIVRELNGDMVVQWAEPDAVFLPGVELIIYAGRGEWVDGNLHDKYLWVSSPSQMGTVVIPKAHWDMLKAKLIDSGFDYVNIRIIYRTRDFSDMTDTWYMNRGYSEKVEFPISP